MVFKNNVVAYYANIANAEVIMGSDDIIGVPLDVYFPQYKAAAIYSKPLIRDCLVRRENAKNWLCLNAGIKLFRIADPGSDDYENCICICITLENRSLEVLGLAIQMIFDMLGIDADVDIERDLLEIKSFSKKF